MKKRRKRREKKRGRKIKAKGNQKKWKESIR